MRIDNVENMYLIKLSSIVKSSPQCKPMALKEFSGLIVFFIDFTDIFEVLLKAYELLPYILLYAFYNCIVYTLVTASFYHKRLQA